jgi:hypothetical protein
MQYTCIYVYWILIFSVQEELLSPLSMCTTREELLVVCDRIKVTVDDGSTHGTHLDYNVHANSEMSTHSSQFTALLVEEQNVSVSFTVQRLASHQSSTPPSIHAREIKNTSEI